MKNCTVCKQKKPTEHFYNRKASEDGKAYRCKECDNNAVRIYRKKHTERYKIKARTNQLRFIYGIEPEDYGRMLSEQDGVCAICSGPPVNTNPPFNSKLVIDHCHITGTIRGLLCQKCNKALGLFKDSPEILQKAIKYLIH